MTERADREPARASSLGTALVTFLVLVVCVALPVAGGLLVFVEALFDGADDELETAARNATIVLDCCDNFGTRFAVNAACVATGRPLVSGAAIRMGGPQ